MPLVQQGGLRGSKGGLQGIETVADRFLAGYLNSKQQAQDDAMKIWQMAQRDPWVLDTPEAQQILQRAGYPKLRRRPPMTPEQAIAGAPPGYEARITIDPQTGAQRLEYAPEDPMRAYIQSLIKGTPESGAEGLLPGLESATPQAQTPGGGGLGQRLWDIYTAGSPLGWFVRALGQNRAKAPRVPSPATPTVATPGRAVSPESLVAPTWEEMAAKGAEMGQRWLEPGQFTGPIPLPQAGAASKAAQLPWWRRGVAGLAAAAPGAPAIRGLAKTPPEGAAKPFRRTGGLVSAAQGAPARTPPTELVPPEQISLGVTLGLQEIWDELTDEEKMTALQARAEGKTPDEIIKYFRGVQQ